MIWSLRKIQMLIACIFIASAKCASLYVRIELGNNRDFDLESNQPTDSGTSVHKWTLLNSMPKLQTTAMPSNVHSWRLLNTIPPSTPTQHPSRTKTFLLNTPKATTSNTRIEFPKEDFNLHSLHEYQPTSRPAWSTTTSKSTKIFNTKTRQHFQQKFNGKFFKELAPKFTNANLIYSPSALENMLAQLYLGAEGRTAAQLQTVLELPAVTAELAPEFQATLADTNIRTDDFKFLVASKIYFRDDLTLDPSFKQMASDNFNTDLERISFAKKDMAAREINKWVAEKTEQHIDHIVDAEILDDQTQAMLVNAIYLKAKWARQFSSGDTEKMDFYTRNDLKHAKLVDMMYIEEEFNYGHFPALEASIVELPFLDSELSMLIIIPNSINGLQEVEQRLKAENLNDLLAQMELKKITLRLPKFKVETELNAVEPLEKLGVQNIFTPNAELGKMFSNYSNVRVSKILQKAFINVNEGGVEAAAATYSQIVPLSLEPNMIYLTADHPFMFAIRSRQDVHFMGHVIDNFQ